jgi:hypothetical protein
MATTQTLPNGSKLRMNLSLHQRYCVSEQRFRPDCPVCHGEADSGALIRTEIITMGGPVSFNDETKQLETGGAPVVAVIQRPMKPVTYNPNQKPQPAVGPVTAVISGNQVEQNPTRAVTANPSYGYRNPSATAYEPKKS